MSNFIFSNEQKRIVEYDKNAVIQVNGCPGSGKTLVAIKKSLFLANKYNKKVLCPASSAGRGHQTIGRR